MRFAFSHFANQNLETQMLQQNSPHTSTLHTHTPHSTLHYLLSLFTCGSEACSSVFASNGGSLLPVCTVRVLQRHVLHLVIRGLQGQCGTVWYCSNKGSLVPVWSNCVTTLSPSLSVWPSSGLVRLHIVLLLNTAALAYSFLPEVLSFCLALFRKALILCRSNCPSLKSTWYKVPWHHCREKDTIFTHCNAMHCIALHCVVFNNWGLGDLLTLNLSARRACRLAQA